MRGQWGRAWHKPRRLIALHGSHLPLELRLFLAAEGIAQEGGHAHFGRDGLQQAVPKTIDEQTGEVTLYSSAALNKAIRNLKKGHLIAEPSNVRCLILPLDLWDKTHRSVKPCPEHDGQPGPALSYVCGSATGFVAPAHTHNTRGRKTPARGAGWTRPGDYSSPF